MFRCSCLLRVSVLEWRDLFCLLFKALWCLFANLLSWKNKNKTKNKIDSALVLYHFSLGTVLVVAAVLLDISFQQSTRRPVLFRRSDRGARCEPVSPFVHLQSRSGPSFDSSLLLLRAVSKLLSRSHRFTAAPLFWFSVPAAGLGFSFFDFFFLLVGKP
jgi:hypothetical protein